MLARGLARSAGCRRALSLSSSSSSSSLSSGSAGGAAGPAGGRRRVPKLPMPHVRRRGAKRPLREMRAIPQRLGVAPQRIQGPLRNLPVAERFKRMFGELSRGDRKKMELGRHFHFWCLVTALMPAVFVQWFAGVLRGQMLEVERQLGEGNDQAMRYLVDNPDASEAEVEAMQESMRVSDAKLEEARDGAVLDRLRRLEKGMRAMQEERVVRTVDFKLMAPRVFNLSRELVGQGSGPAGSAGRARGLQAGAESETEQQQQQQQGWRSWAVGACWSLLGY